MLFYACVDLKLKRVFKRALFVETNNMINFLKPFSIEVEWIKDIEEFGYEVMQLSKYAPVDLDVNEEGTTLSLTRKTYVGRPFLPRIKCKVCQKVVGTKGFIKAHFEKTHMVSVNYAQLPKND